MKNKQGSGMKDYDLFESVLLTEEVAVLHEWRAIGGMIAEAALTPKQIDLLFRGVAAASMKSPDNRNLLGKGIDKVTAVNSAVTGAYNGLLKKVSNMGPVKSFDQKMDQAFAKLKAATGGDQGAAQYVKKYRNFAKKHPVAQSLIYSAIIAAVGLATGGAGAPAAVGLLKATDRLLQGDKMSMALMKGATAGGLAYGAQGIRGALGNTPQLSPNAGSPAGDFGGGTMAGATDTTTVGSPAGDAAGGTGGGVDTYKPGAAGGSPAGDTGGAMGDTTQRDAAIQRSVAADNPGTPAPPPQQYTVRKGDTLSAIAQRNHMSVRDLMAANPDIRNPDALMTGYKIDIPTHGDAGVYRGGVGTAADTAQKVGTGEYLPKNQSLALQKAGMNPTFKRLRETRVPLHRNPHINHELTIDTWSIMESYRDQRVFFLTESGVDTVFNHVEEGMWDSIKRGAGKVARYVNTKGQNLTNRVTYDKLKSKWKAGPGFSYSGKSAPSYDSEQVHSFLVKQGVQPDIIAAAFNKAGIPLPSTAGTGGSSPPAATAGGASTAATPSAAATSSGAGSSSVPNTGGGASAAAPNTGGAGAGGGGNLPPLPAGPSPTPRSGTPLGLQQFIKSYELMQPAERAQLRKQMDIIDDRETAAGMGTNESQLAELSTDTMQKYVKAASADAKNQAQRMKHAGPMKGGYWNKNGPQVYADASRKLHNREQGIATAKFKIAQKNHSVLEHMHQLWEADFEVKK